MSDLISRQAAMERLMAQNVIMDGSEYHNGFNAGVNRAQEVIKNLPPAQPKRKTGQWIDKSNGIEGAWNYCSVCGEQAIDLYDFCPNCGADMRGNEDGAD